MVDKIEIILNNGAIQEDDILILPDKNICYFKNKKYGINQEIIEKILSILCTWKYEYGNNSNIIDCQEFRITVYSNQEKTEYHGKGYYPNNYFEFLDILGGIQDDK